MCRVIVIFFGILWLPLKSWVVYQSDKCSECKQQQSLIDCESSDKCVWNVSSYECENLENIEIETISYCSGINIKVCASTYGCAYIFTCTTFAGCSAYLKSTTQECQSISNMCVSNGQTCTDTQECKNYNYDSCEKIKDLFSQKCKWNVQTNSCQNFKCSDGDQTYTTDKMCKQLLKECVTTGAGCVSQPLPICKFLIGTNQTCPLMTGADGKCKFGSDNQCDLLSCFDYITEKNQVKDEDCINFQSFCLKSTGKSCTTFLDTCSSYSVMNAKVECFEYFGTDGPCEGEAGATQCKSRICENSKGTTNEDCNIYKQGCITNGVNCLSNLQNCASYQTTQSTCQQYIGLDGKCKWDTITNICRARNCEIDSQISYTTDELCQTNIQSYCLSTGLGCVKTLQSCNNYTSNEVECSQRKGSDGLCKIGQNEQCTALLCSDAPKSMTTNTECNSFQIECVTNGEGCVKEMACGQTYNELSCLGTLENNSFCNWGGMCTENISCSMIVQSVICSKQIVYVQNQPKKHKCFWDGQCRLAQCTDYVYKDDYSCEQALEGCVFDGFAGCVSPSPCSNFKGNKAKCLGFKALCTNLDSATESEFCISRTCSDNGLQYKSDTDCKNYLFECLTNGNGCIKNTAPCSSYNGTQTQCSKFFGYFQSEVQGTQCWNTVDFYSACTEKQCQMATNMKSNSDCQQFLDQCLYDGNFSCVHQSSDCSSYTGNSIQTCQGFKGNLGSTLCWWISGMNCCQKDCSQDTISTTDSECNAFLKGCVTKGIGCTINNKQCTDNVTATNDDECEQFLSGCISTGFGCISKSAPCSAYKGTLETCQKFKGLDQRQLCYNDKENTDCKERQCQDLDGVTDLQCAYFIPSSTSTPFCVTNGIKCVSYPIKCSEFMGTEISCPQFTAIDGPCKTTTFTTTPSNCTPKLCHEAPNTLTNDGDCKLYHPTCITNGRGCVKEGIQCKEILTQSICNKNTKCLWVDQCFSSLSCSELTIFGPSLCFNTLKCIWSNNYCHNYTCDDYDNNYNTHEQCQSKDKNCTTSGSGCITMGICSSYTNPLICNSAQTTESSLRCTWEANESIAKCRMRKCSDYQGTTNEDCTQYGCITSGTKCIGPIYNCSELQIKQLCKIDSVGNPCLFVSGLCYKYTNCGDAIGTTIEECQRFNSLCVPTGYGNCTALSSCEKYTTQQSCRIGIYNTICGWLQTGKCQKFGACSDVQYTLNEQCRSYGINCITDGVKCIEIGLCSSYKTQTACSQLGTDGICTWIPPYAICRLRQCNDIIATSDLECSKFIVTSNQCTTDQKTCVSRQICSSYQNQASCTIGIDGFLCIFAYPYGLSSGIQSCRVKECSDIQGNTNGKCIGMIAGKSCVSNGKICVTQQNCETYTNKISCNGGGTDGICAFTPSKTDPLIGRCQRFTECEMANQDRIACVQKSQACKWNEISTKQTSCQTRVCADLQDNKCTFIPTLDDQSWTICRLVDEVCSPSHPSSFKKTTCLTQSAYTYKWSILNQKCVPCKEINGTYAVIIMKAHILDYFLSLLLIIFLL